MTKLQADIEQYINEKLARGEFHSRDEFTEEAFRVYTASGHKLRFW